MPSKVAELWKDELASGEAYRQEIKTRLQYFWFKLRPCSKRLKQIIRLGKIKLGMKILDFGAGGGHDSVPLAYIGCEVDAFDCCDVVLRNLVAYKESVEKYLKNKLQINTIVADIFDANLSPARYDVVFSCGVMEHFFDLSERKKVYKYLTNPLKKGGRLVTFVPNGNHPLRIRQKAERLGGYFIQEIDYTVDVFEKDIEGTGLILEKAKGFDLFGYIFILPTFAKYRFLRCLIKPFYLFLRLFENWLPSALMQRYAYWLLFVARK